MTQVEQVRVFNRAVAERIGALNADFLGRQRPMAESRLLWEIGPDGVDVRDLRARLGLDSGYTTRLLQSLQRQGLVRLRATSADRRVRRVELTPCGSEEWGELDRRSDAVARGFLEPLDERQRDRLVDAMEQVERLLRASLVHVGVEDPTTDTARWCIGQYFDELNVRFEAGFDPTLSISADAHELAPPAGALLVARLRDQPIGCAALKLHADAPAEIKRMWVAPEARGLGLGRRLLRELEAYAREAGVRVVRLETNRALAEAIQLYRSSGYAEVPAFNTEAYAHHWFEKGLG
jgi:DNA-binding MarR family transcriptional regulator/GNAT superfamily N-acetyltransferase